MTAAGGREDYVSGVSEEAMTQEELEELRAERDRLRRMVDTQMRIIVNALWMFDQMGSLAAEMRAAMTPTARIDPSPPKGRTDDPRGIQARSNGRFIKRGR